MDIETAFDSINLHIKNHNFKMVRPEIDSIVSYCKDDPFILIKCASLLKVIDDEEHSQRILDMVMDIIPDDEGKRFSLAIAMRSMNRPADALDMLEDMDDSEKVLRERTRSYLALDDPGSAAECIGKMDCNDEKDMILKTDVLCSNGDLNEAYDLAVNISKSGTYDSLVNLCTVMIRMGKNKEAMKFARSQFKEDKKNADSLALGAYVLRINGRMSAAANFANNALRVDHTHIGALETMAMCFIEKNKYIEAKVMAGAINNKDPGNPAAIRILDACRISSQ